MRAANCNKSCNLLGALPTWLHDKLDAVLNASARLINEKAFVDVFQWLSPKSCIRLTFNLVYSEWDWDVTF
jgi:hypothetical protein